MENQVSLHEGQAWVSKTQAFQMRTNFEGGDELKRRRLSQKVQTCPPCNGHIFLAKQRCSEREI